MKHARAITVLPALLLGLAVHSLAHAYPWLGTITSLDGGAFNNTTSKVRLTDGGTGSQSFALGYGTKNLLQCDNASCVQSSGDAGFLVTCSSSSGSHGVVIQAGQLFPINFDSSSNVISIIPVSPVPDNCDVFQNAP